MSRESDVPRVDLASWSWRQAILAFDLGKCYTGA